MPSLKACLLQRPPVETQNQQRRMGWRRPGLIAVTVKTTWGLGDSELFMSQQSDGQKSWGSIIHPRVEQQLEPGGSASSLHSVLGT